MANSELTTVLSALEQSGVTESTLETSHLRMWVVDHTSLTKIHVPADRADTLAANLSLPAKTGGCSTANPAALCLRPGEWLLKSDSSEPLDESVFNPGFLLDHISYLLDISDSMAIFRLSGTAAPWLLNKLCGLDFQATTGNASTCVQTRFGHASVIIHFLPINRTGPAYDLMIDRSLARYLWELLLQSADHAAELAESHGVFK